MPTRFHTLVQHTDDFDQATTGHAIVENVDRSSYLDIGIIAARVTYVTYVKTANPGHGSHQCAVSGTLSTFQG